MLGPTEYLFAYMADPTHPEDESKWVEFGRMLKAVAVTDREIFDRWKDVMASAFACALRQTGEFGNGEIPLAYEPPTDESEVR